MANKRMAMTWQGEPPSPSQIPGMRLLARSDGEGLGRLLYQGYHGGVDDQGESEEDAIAEAGKTLAGEYGNPLWNASFVVERQSRLICASVVTEYEGTPLLAFCVTAPPFQRQGLAQGLVRESMRSVRQLGWPRLRLVVTRANVPAVNLYRKLQFVDETA
ncbi:MAG TPA: GNAT family N-acetyltransferase [Bryobacteraceae bacterium]|nr:GNAT family N-acetyltransferase [Bryobacteraceae bacterium]